MSVDRVWSEQGLSGVSCPNLMKLVVCLLECISVMRSGSGMVLVQVMFKQVAT